jgi:hypothetical protein
MTTTMTARYERQGLTLDEFNPNTPWIKDFAVRSLWRTLAEFQCGEFEAAKYVQFFWDQSRFWAPQASQAKFDAAARARLDDKIRYSRRRADAWHVIDQYFDKQNLLTLDDVVAAVTFCSPTAPIPSERVFTNAGTVIVDMTKRKGMDRFLKVDTEFFPILERLYPFERRGDKVIKVVRVGSVREFDLKVLAFWHKYRNALRAEMDRAVTFHSADTLDWTTANLYSRWREGGSAERFAARIDPQPEDAGTVLDAEPDGADDKPVSPDTPLIAPCDEEPDDTRPFCGATTWLRRPSASARVVPMPDDLENLA